MQGRNQLFISGGVGAIITKFYSMTLSCLFNRGITFANSHRQISLRNISENNYFSVLIKMQTERSRLSEK